MSLCALADLKQYLGITTNSTDNALTALIGNASSFIERYCNRVFEAASYTETRNGNGADAIYMRNTPVIMVSSVSIDGVAVPEAPDARSYGWVNDNHKVYLRGYARIDPSSAHSFTAAPGCFRRGIQNVQIAYVAGFTTVPVDVSQACIELIASKFAKRGRIDKKSEVLAQQTTAFDLSDMPASVKTALAQWKVPMIAP